MLYAIVSEAGLTPCFQDRFDAGRRLAERLGELHFACDLVFGIPRGGIPVGVSVANALGRPFEAFVARKLGAPMQQEFGIGAIAEGGGHVLDRHSIDTMRITPAQIEELLKRESRRVEDYIGLFRGGRPLPDVSGAGVIVVDDGLATGVTVQAAVTSLRSLGAARVVVAVPVASDHAVLALEQAADQVIALCVPPNFTAVGQFYVDFDQLPDADLVRLPARRYLP
jgi:putative phosphoribosyl transferase